MTDTTPLTPDQLAEIRGMVVHQRGVRLRYAYLGVDDLAALLDMAEQGQRAAAEVKAEALREAADAMDAASDFRDPLRLKSDWLRSYAAALNGDPR